VRICALIPRTRPRASSSGPARVAAVDGRVGLDGARGAEAGQRLDRAVQRRDDPDRQRLLLAERAPDRGDGGAHDEVVRGAERQRAQAQAGGVDPQQRDVGERVEADDVGPHLVAVAEVDVDRPRTPDVVALAGRDDVGVRRDLAAPVEHEARSLAGAAAVAATLDPCAEDRHDTRGIAPVDPFGVEAALAAGLLDDLHARRALDRLRLCGGRIVACPSGRVPQAVSVTAHRSAAATCGAALTRGTPG
jgi:hypothetical protein